MKGSKKKPKQKSKYTLRQFKMGIQHTKVYGIQESHSKREVYSNKYYIKKNLKYTT